jgi:hypothetical protein
VRELAAGVGALVLFATPLVAERPKVTAVDTKAEQRARTGIPVARVAVIGGAVELSESGHGFEMVEDGFRLKTGDRMRTGPDTVARIEFPWVAVTAAPASTIWIPSSVVLSTVLEEGRAEVKSSVGEIVKLRTTDAQVRGRGHVVVRRESRATLVSVLDGSFRVEAGGRSIVVARGDGAIVEPGAAPTVVTLPPSPDHVFPGSDPVYVVRGTPAALSWQSSGTLFHVQLLSLDSGAVLLDKELASSPQGLEIPWLGTFRWRVSERDARGLESVPSEPGVVCVVEK